MKLRLFLFTIILLSSEVFAKGPPPGTGEGDVKANIMIMLDDSGSMSATDPSPGMGYQTYGIDIANNGDIFAGDLYYKVGHLGSDYALINTFGGSNSSYSNNGANPPIAIYNTQYAGVKLDPGDSTDEYMYVGGYYFSARGGFTKGTIKKICTGITTTAACPKKGVLVATNEYKDNQYYMMNIAVGGNYVYSRSYASGYLYQYQKSNLAQVRKRTDINSVVGSHSYANDDVEAVGDFVYVTSYSSSKVCKFNGSDLSNANFSGGSNCVNLGYRPKAAGVSGRTTASTADDFLYTWDGNKIRKHDLSDGSILITKSVRGTSAGKIYDNTDIATDSSGNVYFPEKGSSSRTYVSKFDADLIYISRGPSSQSQGNRMAVAHAAIRAVLKDPDLTAGADFGIMSWGTQFKIRTEISPQGANHILNTTLAQIRPNGGTYLGKALQIVRTTYWHNSSKTPIDTGAKCQGNFNLVLSDGQYFGSPTPETEMPNLSQHSTMPVKTFIVGLGNSIYGYQNYVNLAKAAYGDTTPPGAMFANNITSLTLQLRSAILSAINGKLTFTSPKVDFNATPNGFICQPSFKYKEEDQWEGLLTRFSLKTDGSIDDPTGANSAKTIHFHKKLNGRSSLASDVNGRKIWTVDDGIDNPTSGLNKNNNFDAAYTTEKGGNMVDDAVYDLMMGSADHLNKRDVARIMKYMRGQDMFDSDGDCPASTDAISYTANCYTEDKGGSSASLLYKLNDLYNSTPGYVGKPTASTSTDIKNTESEYRYNNNYDTFKTNKANRKNVLFVGSNGGMLHAFDNGCTPQSSSCPMASSPGTELWAFVPPSVLKSMKNIVSPQLYTKLDSALSASATSITTSNSGLFPSSGIVRIDGEYIKYTSNSSNVLSGLTRSYDCSSGVPFCSGTAGTSGDAHADDTIVYNESEVRKPKFSVYTVDGPVVAKDIYTNGNWKTIAMVGYGKGGRGYSVLDVTDPDNPVHMFTILNDVNGPGQPRKIKLWQTLYNGQTQSMNTTLQEFSYSTNVESTTLTVAATSSEVTNLTVSDASSLANAGFITVKTTGGSTEIIQYGAKSGNQLQNLTRAKDANENSSAIALDVGSIITQDSSCALGVGSVPAIYDYRRLALTTSMPHILNIKNASGQKKWVAVFGAGHNYGVDCLTGNAVYVMDLEDDPGTLIKEIIIPDDPTNTIQNSVHTNLTVIQRDATAKADYYGALIYVVDLENKLWKIDLTEKAGSQLGRKIKLFGDLATAANGRRNYQQVTAVLDSSQNIQVGGGQTDSNILRLYWGTGDMANLADRTSTIKNRMYGISDMSFKFFGLPWQTAADTLSKTPMYSASDCNNTTSLNAGCPVLSNTGSKNIGWYNELPKAWKVSGKKVLYDKEQVYFVIYEPTSKLCSPGDAILGSYQYMCPNQRRLVMALGAGLGSGVSTQGSQIYVGVSNAGTSGTYQRGDIIEQSGSDFGGTGGSAQTIANQVKTNSKGTEGLIVLSPVGTQSTGVSTIDAWKQYTGENYYSQ